jgi:hypothetical protein
MGVDEFGGRNGTGNFGREICWPAGIGRTTSSVTITISSVFVRLLVFD